MSGAKHHPEQFWGQGQGAVDEPAAVLAPSHFIHFHFLIEAGLVIVILYILFRKPSRKQEGELSRKEVDDLVEEWEPEPLYTKNHVKTRDPLVVESALSRHVKVEGDELLNFASYNFSGLICDKRLEKAAETAIRKYGVGSCGPRGFYGTLDVHLQLEEHFAQFMQCPEAILYSYGFSTVPSVIPAFSKRGDLIILDEGVNFSIQTGSELSRADILYFKHNDMADLERVLEAVQVKEGKNPKKLVRRFIVTEGICNNYGDIAPLPDLLRLKEQYRYRLIVDETNSIGVLGKTGRGLSEHYDVPVSSIDIITCSMGTSLSSVGGLCVGSVEIVNHQRLSGSGYCFSASLPPYLAVVADEALKIIETSPKELQSLRTKASAARRAIEKIPQVEVSGTMESPIMHVRLAPKLRGTRAEDIAVLYKVVDSARESSKILFNVARYNELKETHLPEPSIRVMVSNAHTTEDITSAAAALKEAFAQAL